ncbi:C-GCAxxG-C-C family protein [Treponema zioleckii]|uniref:C-GCAxxG-C-C family protein n=1 Tax=Treponema zioleckii TaxID=331680 RepID=UPI00168AB108|nr:C-GCAxxG-C-C family protein [Treponema zioleckii]
MTVEERAENAAQLKLSGACNCCQAVTRAFADTVGVDEETLMKMSAGFAVGMGCMEATCGSLIGAGMIAGLRTDGKGTPRYTREILAKFKEMCGAVACKDLKGITTGKVLCECHDCVKNAVLATEQVFSASNN